MVAGHHITQTHFEEYYKHMHCEDDDHDDAITAILIHMMMTMN